MLAHKNYRGFRENQANGIVWVGTVSLWLLVSLCLTGCVSYPEYPTPVMTEQFNQEKALNSQQQPYYSQQTDNQPLDRQAQSYYSQQPRTDLSQTNPLTTPVITENASNALQPRVYYIHDPANPRADERGFVRVTDSQGYILPQQTIQPANQWQQTQPSQTPTVRQQPSAWNNQQNYNNPAGLQQSATQQPALAVVSGVSIAEDSVPYSTTGTTLPYDRITTQPAGAASAPSNQGITSMADSGGTAQIAAEQTVLPVVNIPAAPSSVTAARNLTQPAVAQQPQPGPNFSGANVEEAIKYLERLIDLHPEDVNYQMALRLLYCAYGDKDKALRQLPGMSSETQSKALTLAQAVVLASEFQVDKNNPVSANRALEALKQLTDEVAEKADLNILSLKICKSNSVRGFGLYEVLPKQQLETGDPCKILVYCELQNFKSQLNAEGKYITSLHADITLYDAGFTPVVKLSCDVEDVPSFNQRHDFFLRGPIDIPQLAPGKYEIVVSIEDKVAGKKALPQRYEFQVAATGK
jgi:hypothetical protein